MHMNIHKFTKKQIAAIKQDYVKRKKSLKKISNKHDISVGAITRLLDKCKISRRSSGDWLTPKFASKMSKRYRCNTNFFSRQTAISAYWAGFIAADGYINPRDVSVRISLKSNDVLHLSRFKKDLSFNGKIKNYVGRNSYTGKRNYYSVIEIFEETIVNDLKRIYKITTKKSLTLKPPNLHKNMILPFIIGLIDGDGSIYYRSGTLLTVSLLGTKSIVTWVKKQLEKQGIFSGKIYKYKNKNAFSIGIWDFQSLCNLKKLVKYMNLPVLNRKWKKLFLNKRYAID